MPTILSTSYSALTMPGDPGMGITTLHKFPERNLLGCPPEVAAPYRLCSHPTCGLFNVYCAPDSNQRWLHYWKGVLLDAGIAVQRRKFESGKYTFFLCQDCDEYCSGLPVSDHITWLVAILEPICHATPVKD